MQFILENLAIGNIDEAGKPPDEIDSLLCVAEEHDPDPKDLLYHKVPVADMQPIPEHQMREAVEWIQEHISGQTIMVFCNAGIGRSPSVVVGYLYCYRGFGYGEAVEYVARKKPYMSTLPDLITCVEHVKTRLK